MTIAMLTKLGHKALCKLVVRLLLNFSYCEMEGLTMK